MCLARTVLGTFATIEITRRGREAWDIFIGITVDRLRQAGVTPEEFAESWHSLLERVGDFLYDRTRPPIGLVYGTHDTIPDFSKPVLDREIGVGWRSWYGAAYIERYGHDWLRKLPDRTRELAYAGVAQAIDRPLLDVVTGSRDLYDSLWPYLDSTGIITPFWPRKRRPAIRSIRNQLPKRKESRGLHNHARPDPQ